MKIILDLFELKNICMEMAELGAAASEKKRAPVSDEISQREVYRWIKTMGYDPSFLDKLEELGLIHKYRKGTTKKSPIMYSKFEIQTVINSHRMGSYINK